MKSNRVEMLETAFLFSFCAFVSVKNLFFKEPDTDFPFLWNNKPDEMIMNICFPLNVISFFLLIFF